MQEKKYQQLYQYKTLQKENTLLMATRNGLIKETALKEYDTTRKTGLQGIKH